MRDHAQDSDVSRRVGHTDDHTLSASAAAASAATPAAGHLPGRNDGSRGYDLPDSAPASAATPLHKASRRARITF
jgi:hypothetical protein